MTKPIQEQFGQIIIDAVAQFAAVDLDRPQTIEANYLAHVGDQYLRKRLAEVWYGARWIYKLGLALLVKNEEQTAHVRAQVVDYAAVCEGVLLDMVDHAMVTNRLTGQKWLYRDPDRLAIPNNWRVGRHKTKLAKMPFYWFICVAEEEGIVSQGCSMELQWLRDQRNKVHVRAGSVAAYLGTSRRAYETVHKLVTDTRAWRHANP